MRALNKAGFDDSRKFWRRTAALVLCSTLAFTVARAQTCESVFSVLQADAVGPLQILRDARTRLAQEQLDVRTRVWTDVQIDEIGRMGRIVLPTRDLALKYYRGLVLTKIRLIEQEMRKLTEPALLERVQREWSAVSVFGDKKIDIFSAPEKLRRVLRFIQDKFSIEEPTEMQVTAVFHAIEVLKQIARHELMASVPRGVETDNILSRYEATVLGLLEGAFPGARIPSIHGLKSALLLIRIEEAPCCRRGDCPTCTHPNVTLRDKKLTPGPSHDLPAPTATLPLFIVMQDLRQSFPKQALGYHFWDLHLDPLSPRF